MIEDGNDTVTPTVRSLRDRAAGSLTHFPLPRPDLKPNASPFHAIPATQCARGRSSCSATSHGLGVLLGGEGVVSHPHMVSVSGDKVFP